MAVVVGKGEEEEVDVVAEVEDVVEVVGVGAAPREIPTVSVLHYALTHCFPYLPCSPYKISPFVVSVPQANAVSFRRAPWFQGT